MRKRIRTSLPEEKWLPVVGYEDLYEVSSWGRIKILKKNYIMKVDFSSNRHKNVTLGRGFEAETWGIHRVVATAFLPNPDNLPIVNHIDGIKCHNNVENLEWVTAKENAEHAQFLELRKRGTNGTGNNATTKTDSDKE